MILTNYYKWLEECKSKPVWGDNVVSSTVLLTTRGRNEDWIITSNNSNAVLDKLNSNRRLDSNITIYLGNSQNPVTKSDYALATDITSNFSASVQSVFNIEDNNCCQLFTIGCTNNSSSEQTIRQIGIAKTLLAVSSSHNDVYLFAVYEPETPITVGPGESFTKVIKWIDE